MKKIIFCFAIISCIFSYNSTCFAVIEEYDQCNKGGETGHNSYSLHCVDSKTMAMQYENFICQAVTGGYIWHYTGTTTGSENVGICKKCQNGQIVNDDGAFCDDFNPCTENDKCQNGTCVGTPVCNVSPSSPDNCVCE